jgi:acid phosphatase (class A)
MRMRLDSPRLRLAPRLAAVAALFIAVPGALLHAQGAPAAPTSAARSAGECVDPQTLSLQRLLPPPPAADSAQQKAELAEMLRIQRTRTSAEVEQARRDVETSVFRFADALGDPPAFVPGKLPRTEALFRDVGRNETAILNAAKDAFARPRPFQVDREIDPVVTRPPSWSYPSGHATWAATVAVVLADMVPERRAAILERARGYGHNRVVGGVHYPSDVQEGFVSGTVLAAMLFDCPAFAAEEAAAKAELRRALALPAQ